MSVVGSTARPDFQSGLLTGQQEIDLQRYFLDVHERQANGDQFPFNLEELVPTVYSTKQKALQALTKGYTQGVDFTVNNQLVENLSPFGGRPADNYCLTAATFEHLVAKKNRAIFEVYRRVFHAAAAEAIKLLAPRFHLTKIARRFVAVFWPRPFATGNTEL